MMKRVQHNLYINILIILLFVILSILSSCLLVRYNTLFGAGDMQFHLQRIIDLEKSFRHGSIFPEYSFNNFHGSAVFTLYPYINLYPIILLSFIIKSNILLVYIFFDINVFIALIISYYSSLTLSKSKKTSILFSLSYSLAIPFLAYGFYNMDLGVLTSLTAYPLIVFGLFNLIKNDKWIGFALGFILIIFSHVLSIFIALGFVALMLLINFRYICNKKVIEDILKSLILVMLLTSIVWIPMIKFIITNLGNIYPPMPGTLTEINIVKLLRKGLFGNITYGIGIISLISIFLPIIYLCFEFLGYKSKLNWNRYTEQLYGVAIFIIVVCSIPIWKLTNFGIFRVFKIFQFVWRFYVIPELLLDYIFAVFITQNFRSKKVIYGLMSSSFVIIITFLFIGQYRLINESITSPSFTKSYVSKSTYNKKIYMHHMMLNISQLHFVYYRNPRFPYYKINNNIQLNRLTNTYTDENGPDYYPIRSLSELNCIGNDEGKYDNNKKVIKNIGYNTFIFSNKNKVRNLILPILHYNDEHINIYDNRHIIKYNVNKHNLIELKNLNKGNHILNIEYVPNIFLTLIKIILFLVGVLWLFKLNINKLRNKNITGLL